MPGLRTAPPDERSEVGVGMLGYGFMGKAHSNAWRTFPYVFWPASAKPRLLALCGRTETAVGEAAVRYGWESFTTDWRDLVADDRIRIFDNAGSDAAHVEPTLAAAVAGKHVVCEKPLALTAGEAEELWRGAERAGVKHLTCFNYRFLPAVRLARELIEAGDIGEIVQARFRYSQQWRMPPNAKMPSPGGALNVIGVHAIDLARYLVDEIEAVSAVVGRPLPLEWQSRDGVDLPSGETFAALLEFSSGASGLLDASLVAAGRRNMLAWEINGAKGSLEWNLEELGVLRVYRSGTGGFETILATEAEHALAAPWWPSGHLLGWEHGHVNMLAHFFAAVVDDGSVAPHGATFYDGFRAAQVCEAVALAAGQGRRAAVAAAGPGAGS